MLAASVDKTQGLCMFLWQSGTLCSATFCNKWPSGKGHYGMQSAFLEICYDCF